jgi:lysophospholipase
VTPDPTAPPPAAEVLVLCTGGTIGMTKGPDGWRPAPELLANILRRHPTLQDPDGPPRCTPPLVGGRRVRWEVQEYELLLDSSNMGREDWVRIARDIAAAHDRYDGIVVLHGTDTMAWTASALSFMLQDLAKPVILTGAQIPSTQARSDALDNLLGALIFAGALPVPEVCVFFDNTLYRGNRVRKVDADGLHAFDSANLRPLATVGVGVEVAWEQVRPVTGNPLRLRPITQSDVAVLRLFPGISGRIVRNVLAPPLRGAVIETFGTGNAPDNRPDLLAAFREATDRGAVLVNITQCARGTVRADYAAGRALEDAGVVSGLDMTTEAALTKLAYLLSELPEAPDTVRTLVGTDLRGELSPPGGQATGGFRAPALVESVHRVLGEERHVDAARAIYPVLLCDAAAAGNRTALARLLHDGVDLNMADYDGRTALHLAAAEGHRATVAWLLRHGADPTAEDRWGRTPRAEAQRGGHASVMHLLDGISEG